MTQHRDGHFLGLLAAVGALTACVGTLEPPAGTSTSEEFIRLFTDACLRPFPDPEANARAFLAQGFVEAGDSTALTGFWNLERRADGLSATAVPAAASPPEFRAVSGSDCTLIADLSDPEHFATDVLSMADERGVPVPWERSDLGLHATLNRQGTTWELLAGLPQPHGTPFFDLAHPCQDGQDCPGWGGAQLGVYLAGAPPGFESL